MPDGWVGAQVGRAEGWVGGWVGWWWRVASFWSMAAVHARGLNRGVAVAVAVAVAGGAGVDGVGRAELVADGRRADEAQKGARRCVDEAHDVVTGLKRARSMAHVLTRLKGRAELLVDGRWADAA